MAGMTHFVRHEPCPQCGSRNNLGVWDDGHKWCFGCGYYVPSNELERVREHEIRLNNKNKRLAHNNVTLPDDYSRDLAPCAKEWIAQYGITDREIALNRIGWSDDHGAIVYPVYDDSGNLLMYQSRHMDGVSNHKQRFYTQGEVEAVFHLLGPLDNDRQVVVVEDMISAIKVGRHAPCMPLWGSTISTYRLTVLGQRFKSLIIWLDKDKAKYAAGRAQVAKLFFDDVKVVVTEKDPKACSDKEIRDVI